MAIDKNAENHQRNTSKHGKPLAIDPYHGKEKSKNDNFKIHCHRKILEQARNERYQREGKNRDDEYVPPSDKRSLLIGEAYETGAKREEEKFLQ